MAYTKAQRIEITGRAIAHRLRSKGYTGARLDRAIEEVADDMHDRDTVAGETLRATFESGVSGRDWGAIKRQVRRTLDTFIA